MKPVATCLAVALVVGASRVGHGGEAQGTIISKRDTDYVFSLTRPVWEEQSKKFFPRSWIVRSTKHDTGTQIIGFDPSNGIGLSIRPLYRNDYDPPDSLVVDHYFPVGTLKAMTDELKNDIERAAQKDLGSTYSVRLNYTTTERLEAIELIVTKNK
jgi:hypothetical protein